MRITPAKVVESRTGDGGRFRWFRIDRKMLYGIAALFVIFSLVLNAQKFWVCVGQTTPVDWAHTPGEFCSLGRQVGILEIVTDIIGDLLLVIIPIRLLWSLRVFRRSLHIRLVSVFGMSLVTTAVSLCQNYYQIHTGGIRDFIVSHVEVRFTLSSYEPKSDERINRHIQQSSSVT